MEPYQGRIARAQACGPLLPGREAVPRSEGRSSRLRDFNAHDLDRCASDADCARGREAVADQARDFLSREAPREQARFGASIGRVGEQAGARRRLIFGMSGALSRALHL